jgi:hypothetical protein
MIFESIEVGVHVPSLLEKVGKEVDKWWFGQTTGATELALMHLPHLSSSSVVGVVWHLGGRSQLCVSTSLEDLPTLIIVPGVIIQRNRWKQKGRLY